MVFFTVEGEWGIANLVPYPTSPRNSGNVVSPLNTLVSLSLLLPSLAAGARRLVAPGRNDAAGWLDHPADLALQAGGSRAESLRPGSLASSFFAGAHPA
jgi:hypothetical protein